MREFTPFIYRGKKPETTETERSELTSIELDEELVSVLDQLCVQLNLTSYDDALNVLIMQQLYGGLRDSFSGHKRPPRLSVIKGGQS